MIPLEPISALARAKSRRCCTARLSTDRKADASKRLLVGADGRRCGAGDGLAILLDAAVEHERLAEHQLHPRRVRVSRALVVVDDGADAAAEDDVARQTGVCARDC